MEKKQSFFKAYIAKHSFDSLYTKYLWLKFIWDLILSVLTATFTAIFIDYTYRSKVTHRSLVYIILGILILYLILLLSEAIVVLSTSKNSAKKKPNIDLARKSSIQFIKFLLRLVKLLLPIFILGTSQISNDTIYIITRIWAIVLLVMSLYGIINSILNYFYNRRHKKFYLLSKHETNDEYERFKELYDKFLADN